MAMLSFSRSYILFFVLFLLITTSSLILLRVQAENRNGNKDIDHGNNKESFGKQRGEEGKEQEPALVERAIGITGFTNRWDSIRNWFKLAWLNLRPPDSGYHFLFYHDFFFFFEHICLFITFFFNTHGKMDVVCYDRSLF